MTNKQFLTATSIFLKGFKEPYLRANERPFIKLLNWYTGIGKTYNAAAFGIELFLKCDVIPVFIAPLQSLVTQFSSEVLKHQENRSYADELEEAIRDHGAGIPIYRLYSRDYHVNDRTFFSACLALVKWLERHPYVVNQMERSPKHEGSDKSVRARIQELRVKAASCEQSNFLGMSTADESYEDARAAYIKSAQQARSLADRFVWKLIQLDVQSRPAKRDEDRYMQAPEIAELVYRLHPLQAFLDTPGIIVSTASKAQVAHKVFTVDGKGGFRQRDWENLPQFLEELNQNDSTLGRLVSRRPDSARVITFVDEEEDSYWYLFDQRKSVVNSGGRNDLNLVISEFFQYFDLKWPMAFERLERDGPRRGLAKKVYEHLEEFAAISKSVEDEFRLEVERTRASFIAPARKVAILREKLEKQFPKTVQWFNDAELLAVLTQLHERNDAHAGFKRFRQKARVLASIRSYVEQIAPRDQGTTYDVFVKIHDLVANKKFFTMSRSTYGEVLDQPGQTFFTESASVMDTEFLRQVQLTKDTAEQTIRLQYHDGKTPDGAYTLYDYLRLVVFMARVLAVTSGEEAIEMSKVDQKRYPSLDEFRSDVRRLFNGQTTSEGLETEVSDKELLTDSFLFEHTKSVVTLEESRNQAEEYNKEADVCLTLTITSLRATPEEDIVRALGRTNGVYLMSATGGLDSASSGAFNTKHLRRYLEERGGLFSQMSDDELAVVGAKAVEFLNKRDREVVILNDDEPASTFEVSTAFKGLYQQFDEARPKKGDFGYAQLNRHKRHELQGLVASLDKLMATSIRSGLVLCQTTEHVKKCLQRMANSSLGLVEHMDNTGDHFIIKPGAMPTYNGYSQKEDIHIVLYSAERFRKKDRSKTGAVDLEDDKGQFSKELEDALDISRKKILLWSAYASASRGINFLTKQHGTERDFELFCLLNDPYYTRHTRPSASGFSMEMFQSFAQVLRDEPGWAAMSKGELLFEYSRNRWKRLRKEHVIDITRTVFQALGRGERRPSVQMPKQHLYISSEAARMVHLGLRHAPELRKRASPAQRAVLAQLSLHHQKTHVFEMPEEREQHHVQSLEKAIAFREFTGSMPGRFRTDESTRRMWELLFRSTMFTDPVKYMDDLRAAGVPDAYLNGCFVEVPMGADVYTLQFTMAIRSDLVVTDAEDGTEAYDWTSMVVPESLISRLTESTRKLLKEWRGFRLPDRTKRLLPQPWFVTEIMKGYIAELEFEQYVGDQFAVWAHELPLEGGPVTYVKPEMHPLYAELYQLYDYYLQPEPDVWVAVDLKNWTRNTDSLKKDQLLKQAQTKHAKLQALLPGVNVHALYVNLQGAHKFGGILPAKGTIRFMSMYVRNTGDPGWMPNANLRDAILGK
ncbi:MULTISPECIES: hypothetical protein [Giesbergeria]|uniref:Restriction endonuclease n=1 Tax=Giesbergeria sinuosa TaxID=80883 RepID=A0ABV9QDU8_9BURK